MVFFTHPRRGKTPTPPRSRAPAWRGGSWVFVSSNALPRWISYYSHCTMHCVHFAHFRAVQMWTSSHIHLIFDFCILDVAISHAGVRREAGHVHRTAYTPDSLENAPRGVP